MEQLPTRGADDPTIIEPKSDDERQEDRLNRALSKRKHHAACQCNRCTYGHEARVGSEY